MPVGLIQFAEGHSIELDLSSSSLEATEHDDISDLQSLKLEGSRTSERVVDQVLQLVRGDIMEDSVLDG